MAVGREGGIDWENWPLIASVGGTGPGVGFEGRKVGVWVCSVPSPSMLSAFIVAFSP